MFSTGQIVFAFFFIVVFSLILLRMYQKDLNWHKIHYKGTKWVFFAFISFILILLTMKYILKN